MKKVEFSVGGVNLQVTSPSAKVRQDAQKYRAKEFGDAVKGGAMVKQELDGYLRKSMIWGDEQRAAFEKLRKSIVDAERVIEKKVWPNGKPVRLEEAKKVALQLSKDRASLQELLAARNQVESNTADALADAAQFNYLVAHCTFIDSGPDEGKPYFKGVDDYLERAAEPAAYEAASRLSDLLYGSAEEILSKLPEAEFLRKYRFVDKEGRLIDKEGNYVDENGRKVDGEGYYLDEEGRRVDVEGNLIDGEGRYLAAPDAAFLDEDGNPVTDPDE